MLLLLVRGGVPVAMAQTNPPANRYLLIIETSQSMQRRAAGINNAVGLLLTQTLKTQLSQGDTLGLWTFAEDLYTGRFPLQHWSPQQNRPIMERVLTFLNQQTYEKQANYDKLRPALDRVIKASPFITVILVTDGEEPMRGTPFDKQINDVYKSWRERQQQAQMPFLTVLRGQNGTLTNYAIAPAPWPVELPPLPPELQLTKSAPVQSAPETKAPAPAGPVLVFHGTDPNPSKVEPSVAASSAMRSALAPGLLSTQKLASATAVSGTNLNPQASIPGAAPGAPQADISDAPVLLAQAESLRYHAPGMTPTPKSNPAAATAATGQARSPSAPSKPAANSAVAVTPTPPASHRSLWAATAVVVTALVGLGLWLARRPRATAHVSLITRSLERESK